jgi:hypothetical protein
METPKYLQVLWGYKWLLLFGAIVAGAAAFFAGFSIQNGEVVSRAEQTWDASTTMLITSDSDPIYQAEIPGVPLEQGVSAPQYNDLAESALIYAYIIASDEIQTQVEAQIGTLDPEKESISAVRRTTQPAGDERFPGRYELPVLEAVGTAPTAERAELISQTVAATFMAYMTAQQAEQALDPTLAVQVELLGENPAVEGDMSNPAIPIVVTFIGVFLAFVVLAFVIAGLRSGAAKRRAAAASAATATEPAPTAAPAVSLEDQLAADSDEPRELVGVSGVPTRSRRPRIDDESQA